MWLSSVIVGLGVIYMVAMWIIAAVAFVDVLFLDGTVGPWGMFALGAVSIHATANIVYKHVVDLRASLKNGK